MVLPNLPAPSSNILSVFIPCEMGDDVYKPKWMRWRTFDRRAEEIFSLEEAADGAFVILVEKLLRRFGPS
jgi:hypothetical protein